MIRLIVIFDFAIRGAPQVFTGSARAAPLIFSSGNRERTQSELGRERYLLDTDVKLSRNQKLQSAKDSNSLTGEAGKIRQLRLQMSKRRESVDRNV